MKPHATFQILAFAVMGLLTSSSPVRAQAPRFEIGTTLTSVTVGVGDDDVTVFGIPSSSFGIINPAVYGSIFLGPAVAIEPQFGLFWASSEGDSFHLLNFVGQIDYFIMGIDRRSPYVFGSVGIIDMSQSDVTPKTLAAGLGYRFPVGDRLTFRVDGRYTHFSEGGGNAVGFGVSIGGLFGEP